LNLAILANFGEYSHLLKWPFQEICETRQTRQHLPSRVAGTRHTRRHSPTCFAWTRQTRQHSPKAIFEKNVTRLAKFARVLSELRKFGTSGHCLA